MKKKVKKIPKFAEGFDWLNAAEITAAATKPVANALGIEQGKVSEIGNAIGDVAGLIPGVGPFISAGVKTLANFAGGAGGTDGMGNATKASGLTRWFGLGRSDNSVLQQANREKNAINAKTQTQHLLADYYNNQNVPTGGTILAAEGGIIPNTLWYEDDGEYGRTPYGEIYKEPEQGKPKDSNLVHGPAGTQILSDKSKYPGTKYTFAKHYEKSIAKVKNYGNDKYAKNSQLLNDKHAQRQFDEHLAVLEEMKNKKIKKVKNGIPAHEGGKNGTTPDLSDMFLYRQPDGKFVMLDINGNRYDVPEMMLPYIQGDEHGYWFGPQTGVAPSAGKWNGSMNFAKQMLNSKNIAKLKNTATQVFKGGAKKMTSTKALDAAKAEVAAERQVIDEMRAIQSQAWLRGNTPTGTMSGGNAAYRDASKASRNLWELTPAQLAAANASAEQYIYDGMVKSNLPYWLTLAGIAGGGGTFLLHEATKDKQPVAINTSASMPVNTNGQTVATTLEKPVEPVVTSTEAPIENEKKEVVVPKKSPINKPSSSKKTTASRVTTSAAPQEEKLTPEQIAESLRIADIGERHWLRGSVTEPKQSFASLAKITPEKIKSQGVNNVSPLTGIKPLTDTTGMDDTGYTGSNWKDNLYRMAVLSQPLWDRAKAEPVNYESPVYKYMPTAVDVSSQLRDADQSYALARYNFANLYPNTGAGMAAGLQAASNRAKQYADIRQYQTNAQNELIGKNVGIYNNWANEHARILNDVYNKSAQNRAAARNINRQNRAAWLSNWGTILRDDKQFAADSQNKALQTEALKPLIQSVYENSDTLIPMLAQYTANKNIKKKSPTR